MIPAAEQEAVASLSGKAAKAKLPPPLLKEIERDARWPSGAKTGLIVSGPAVCAKWLNKIGISAENQGEVVVGTALAAIVFTHTRLARKLEKLIQEAARANGQAAATAPPAPASPAATSLA